MHQKVVLPRFDLPGNSTHVAIRALWVTGGLVVLATLVLGLAMYHHRSLEIASAEEAAAKIATATAAAQRAALGPAPRLEPLRAVAAGPAARAALTTVVDAPMASAAPSVDSGSGTGDPVSTHRSRHHRGKLSGKSRGGMARANARATQGATQKDQNGAGAGAAQKPGRESRSKDDDVVDRLMKQFK